MVDTFKLRSESGMLWLYHNGVKVHHFNSIHNAVMVKQILEKDENQQAYRMPKVLEKVMSM